MIFLTEASGAVVQDRTPTTRGVTVTRRAARAVRRRASPSTSTGFDEGRDPKDVFGPGIDQVRARRWRAASRRPRNAGSREYAPSTSAVATSGLASGAAPDCTPEQAANWSAACRPVRQDSEEPGLRSRSDRIHLDRQGRREVEFQLGGVRRPSEEALGTVPLLRPRGHARTSLAHQGRATSIGNAGRLPHRGPQGHRGRGAIAPTRASSTA